MRERSIPVSILKTSHMWSIVKFVFASWCCIMQCKFVNAHFVCADVGAAAIAVFGGAVFIVVVGVGAEAL